jgi:potassium channel subfamily K
LSNSGKAFFVFWSLLAVPTLTILISNMGDTVIKAFRDLTIWIGSLTVLPDRDGPSSTLRIGLQRLKHGKLYKEGEDEEGGHESPEGAAEQRLLDRLAENVEGKELELADEVRHHGLCMVPLLTLYDRQANTETISNEISTFITSF